METLHQLLRLAACSVILGLCCAEIIPCIVTQDQLGTKYSVPEFPPTGCKYQWLNATDYVLANNGERTDGAVANKTFWTLQLYKCQLEIRHTFICSSEGKKHEAICTTNCSFISGPEGISGNSHNVWKKVGPVVGVLVAVGVVMAVVVPRAVKRRKCGADCRAGNGPCFNLKKTQDV